MESEIKQIIQQTTALENEFQFEIAKEKKVLTNGVFTNSEVHLSEIEIYGFDYDYTIANYSSATQELNYELARDYLVKEMGYPAEILKVKFDKNFAIRGLHYDTLTGYLLKINQFSRVEEDTVFFGRKRVPMEEVKKEFPGRRINDYYAKNNLIMISDLFAVPLANLLGDTIEHLKKIQPDFNPKYLYDDILKAFCYIHYEKLVHVKILENPSKYFEINPKFIKFFKSLILAKKKIFMLTNNSFKYVNMGCKLIFKELIDDKTFGFNDWTEIFDIIMMLAKKPSWYDSKIPFRHFDKKTKFPSLASISEFKKGEIYYGGSFKEFMRISNYSMSKVIYMGDNIYNDLRHPRKFCHWKTVAIIRELEEEIKVMNSKEYFKEVKTLLKAENIFEQIRECKRKNQNKNIPQLKNSVTLLKKIISNKIKRKRELSNKQFGSAFRTRDSASKFYYNVQRYADLYTSDVANFAHYALDHAFFVKRKYFDHEVKIKSEN